MEKIIEQIVRVWNVPLKVGRIIKVATIEQAGRKKSLCKGCESPCCKGILLPILNEHEFLSRKFKFAYTPIPDWMKEQVPNAQFLATLAVHPGKGCPYHDWKTNRCTAWPDCPKSCKAKA